MRTRSLLLGISLVCVAPAQGPTPLFTIDEVNKVREFWAQPGRYSITPPSDAKQAGLWQVRLTVEGSQWLWNYMRAKGVATPPGVDAAPRNEEQKIWETWIDSKLKRDRWEAFQISRTANMEVHGVVAPKQDTSISPTEPPQPRTIPASLLALVGSPPAFAEAAITMVHTVAFPDQTIVYKDHVRPSSPRYPYFRFREGVQSAGAPVKEMPDAELNGLFEKAKVAPNAARIMRGVSILEGGFDSVNTYDTGFVSVGFIQFACLKEGAGSLGMVLVRLKADAPMDFQKNFREFGLDVTPTGELCALDLDTGAEKIGAAAAMQIINDRRQIAVFQRAGRVSEAFRVAQVRIAFDNYWPMSDKITVKVGDQTLTGVVSDVIKSEAGIATLFDRKVNRGKLAPLEDVLAEVAAEVKRATLADLAKFEKLIVQKMKYRRDYLLDPNLSQPADPPSRNSRKPSAEGNRKGTRTARKKSGH